MARSPTAALIHKQYAQLKRIEDNIFYDVRRGYALWFKALIKEVDASGFIVSTKEASAPNFSKLFDAIIENVATMFSVKISDSASALVIEDAPSNRIQLTLQEKQSFVSNSLMRFHTFSQKERASLTRLVIELNTNPKKSLPDYRAKAYAKALNVTVENLRYIVEQESRQLHANVVSKTSKALGFTTFVWGSREDHLVRPVHAAANGQRYSLAEGHPTEGLPGQPPRCRCRMYSFR